MAEEDTSKTWAGCGTIKDTVSLADGTFRCASCNLFVDRDVNGVRNILIECFYHISIDTHTRTAFMVL